jgi:hypothetical protein
MKTEIDITYQVTKNNYKEKFEILKEMIVWLSINLGQYIGNDTLPKNSNPYLYAYGKNWQIKIYTHEENYHWKVWIDDEVLASMFILKFL